ncbi:MAG: hypothetical protein OK436_07000, partial [Thaumarchaeota archaeon]|nr:hypothetical protein [Nitrososphaerota archaeon]
MPSQLKEIVPHPDRSNIQTLFPQASDCEFHSISGCNDSFLQLRSRLTSGGQSAAVYLPVGH